MRAFLTTLGVDYDQWKALTLTALKLDVRTTSLGVSRPGAAESTRRTSKSIGIRAVLRKFVFYLFLGMFMALFVAAIGDRFLAATALFTYVILMVGVAMLVDHNAVITSPDDYGILGYQPITSRTFFASKITNALVYTLGITTALGLLPTGVLGFKHGLLIGTAAFVALYACATTVTLAIVAGYASLMQQVGANRLRTWLSYVQLVTGFLVYGGYFATSELVSENTLAALTLDRTAWLMLLPPTWFAAYLEVAAGSFRGLDLIPVLASLSLLALLTLKLRGRLSLDYAEKLAELSSTSVSTPVPEPSVRKTRFFFRGEEARAAVILIRSHFRNDLRFRMGVLGIIPLTVLYLLMGLRDGMEEGATAEPGQGLSFVTIAVLLFPMLLKIQVAHSESFRASWVFFATPTDRTRLIRASKNVLVASFLVPYLAVLGVTLAFMTRDLLWVATYILLAGSISHLGLVALTAMNPELPFSKLPEKGRNTKRMFGIMILLGVAGAFVPVLSHMVLGEVVRTSAALGAILAITLALGFISRRRIERQAQILEFTG